MQDIAVDKYGEFIFEKTLSGLDDLSFVSGSDWLAQKLRIKFKLWQGEVFSDTDLGIDWFYYFENKNKFNELDALIKNEIINTDYVEKILSYESEFNNKTGTLNIIFSVLYNGEVINAEVQI